jgi:hypothetical protein
MSNYTLPFPDKKLERCQIQQYFNYIVSVSFIGRGNHRPAVLCDIYMLHCFLINWIKSATDMLLICFNKYMTYMRKKKKKYRNDTQRLKERHYFKTFLHVFLSYGFDEEKFVCGWFLVLLCFISNCLSDKFQHTFHLLLCPTLLQSMFIEQIHIFSSVYFEPLK